MDINELNDLTRKIIGCAIEVHKQLGPGLLESAYEECLCYELSLNGLSYERQVPVPVVYKEIKLNTGYRIDVLVEKVIIVELKAIEALTPVHEAQILTHLKFANKKIGLLMNFNTLKLTDQLRRFIK
ncbi:MAG: GxxExxY protein [Ignavibacteriaceae bacterium]|nr:GxxExxY protein [Ignavibacteriaceae bacterium]